MGKITRLAVDLANQIAAGEVVERPASVVKELVENAIDAGARRLAIHVELGGKKQVRVEDDGEGMEPTMRGWRIERHATSKIRRADDLAAITHARLPRRGAAVDRVGIALSCCARAPRGQRQRHRDPRQRRRGGVDRRGRRGRGHASSQVDDLFYNLPARRKFLKSDGAESAQVSRIVTQLALAYPEVGFTLTSGGRKVLAVSARRRRCATGCIRYTASATI